MKPSLGRIPGGEPEPPSWPLLSTSAPMARRTVDVALALDAVIGPDPCDVGGIAGGGRDRHRARAL